MARELAVTGAADVYALTCLMVEMLTGEVLFSGSTPATVMTKHLVDGPTLPEQWPPDVPPELETVLRRGLSRNAAERIKTAGELLTALSDLSKAPKVPLGPPQPTQSRSNWGLRVGGVVALVLIMGLIFYVGFLRVPTHTPVPTPTNTPRPTPTPSAPMVLIPAGPFQMGSESGQDDEKPMHAVTLDAFYIDQYEVTNAQFRQCVEAGTCQTPGCSYYDDEAKENHPVVCVTWDQVNTYCEWRDAKLPTEAEWEKAARGTDGRTYPWGEDIDCEHANYGDCGGQTKPVGSLPAGASPYDIYDMAGNVWEWVVDWYAEDYYSSAPGANPMGPDSGEFRVVRGGTWSGSGDGARASGRGRRSPAGTSSYVGFRCARSP